MFATQSVYVPMLPWWLRGQRICLQYRRPWFDPMKKEMATHSSILAWRIPWTEETGGLQSIGSQGIGYN